MSQSGRGLGRAGRGKDSSKPSSSSSSRSSSSISSGRASARAVPTAYPSTSQSQIGESRVGFPTPVDVSQELCKTSDLTIGEKRKGRNGNGNGTGTGTAGITPVGRGCIRGRRQIAVVEVVKTKPDTCVTKRGDFGMKVNLTTNYFKVETMPNWSLYQYRVDFSVQEERESVLRAWLRIHKDALKGAYIFDGTMLFSCHRLTFGDKPLTLSSFREGDNTPVQITIKLVQELQYGNYVYLQVFNILVRRCLLHLNLQLVTRNYFDPLASVRLPQHNLEIWPGYVTAIRQHERDVLMCAEVAHKVMRTDTALKFLTECSRENRDYRRLFQQAMIGCIVLTDYNNKTYRIDDVDFSVNPMSTFKYRNNEDITYVNYYQQRYQIRITDLKQPLLISRSSAKSIRGGAEKQCLLVPELCRMTGLSSRMIDNRNLMKDLAEVTRLPPGSRLDRLKKFNERLHREEKVVEDFKQWGLSLSRELVTLTGRELPPETIIAGNKMTYSAGADVDWTRSLRSSPMLYCAKFETFVVICASRIKREMEDFLGVLKKAADGMNFHIPRPIIMETNTDGPAEMIEATEAALSKYNPDMILYGFTSDRPDRYSAVKKKCYVDRGVLSQVVLSRSLRSKGVMTVATKIAVQINCKLGGAPWSVHIPADNVMVIGFDVCHGKKNGSVGAVVASLNKAMNVWYSTVSLHEGREELSNTLAMDVCGAIKKYRELNNNTLPTRIFFYRDGVGEGQLHHVYEQEVTFLKKRLTEMYGSESWKLAYIIVTKRINTRFFNNGRNPKPGTIVDDVVTMPEKYDFYLVSQSVRQGTITPTSYNVISDNLDWGPNHIQRFTYKMTHLYYNCSATVRVPAACQYAHKLAFMVSQNLRGQPHTNLSTKLFATGCTTGGTFLSVVWDGMSLRWYIKNCPSGGMSHRLYASEFRHHGERVKQVACASSKFHLRSLPNSILMFK